MKLKYLLTTFVILSIVLLFNKQGSAQKMLNESETAWVNEAKSEMEKALNDPSLSDQQRLEMVEHSTRVLKEYGQPPAFPEDAIPLKKQTDARFEQLKSNISELSNWSLELEFQTLEQKNKIINSMQISVVEEQIKFLIPGVTPIQLSKDVVNTVFDWNITDGVNEGARGDAKGLAARFKQLAESKELIKKINELVESQKEELREAYDEKQKYDELDDKLRRKFEYTQASTITQRGYECAQLASAVNMAFKANVLVGTWRFGFEKTGYFYWTFYNDGTWKFEDKMNDGEEPLKGKYSLAGNVLKLSGPKSQCEEVEGSYNVIIEPEEFRIRATQDPCMSRRFTLSHLWRK
ncbi:hypothetical protein [Mangrovibacterium sp.]|uniref:hypothetical protein n=1 Tax=Mangrovibacterium sp. TaxID=1961364 RepID=UPI0035623124